MVKSFSTIVISVGSILGRQGIRGSRAPREALGPPRLRMQPLEHFWIENCHLALDRCLISVTQSLEDGTYLDAVIVAPWKYVHSGSRHHHVYRLS
jgi:hypothetical protein